MAPAGEIYGTASEYARAERKGVSRRTVIDEAEDKVETVELAGFLCGPGTRSAQKPNARTCPRSRYQRPESVRGPRASVGALSAEARAEISARRKRDARGGCWMPHEVRRQCAVSNAYDKEGK